jgi:hypothetical protein
MNALLKAFRDLPGYRDQLAWHLLSALGECSAPVSFEFIYRIFNKSQQTNSNYRYYAALNRLTEKGFVKQQYGVRGWRLWSITPAGRVMIAQLDAAAQAYLNKKAD